MAQQKVNSAGTFAWHEGGGLFRTLTDEAWLYYTMPTQPPVRDAADWQEREKAATPWFDIMAALGRMAPNVPMLGRRMMATSYRQIHALAIGTPMPFRASRTLDDRNRNRLQRRYNDKTVHDRFTLFGVRLVADSSSTDSLKHKAARAIETAQANAAGVGTPSEMFDHDRGTISRILTDAGCTPPTDAQVERALAWWQTDHEPERIPLMVERTHMHTFRAIRDVQQAADLQRERVDCGTFERRFRHSYAMTVVTLGALPFKGEDERAAARDAAWAANLMAATEGGGMGTLALSIRGAVEPGATTREQIDKDQQQVVEHAVKQMADRHKNNAAAAGDISRADEAYMGATDPVPTLIDARVHAAIPRLFERRTEVDYPGQVDLNFDRQYPAFQDMMIGSNVSYNPSPVFWPSPILAYAGINGKSSAGEDMDLGRDADLPGALLGFTEADEQPVYVSPFVSEKRHLPPLMLVAGDTGAGKTRLMMHVASQWARLPDPDHPRLSIPGVFCDPKPDSDDFEPFIRSMHGRVVKLDDPSNEGILDPLRCMRHGEDMVNTAVEMISSVLGGSKDDRDLQTAILSIVSYGMGRGADCTGEAVAVAEHDHRSGSDGGRVSPDVPTVRERLERMAGSSQIFRLIYGREHGGVRLNAERGLTLLSAGSLNIAADKGVSTAISDMQRWAARMMFLGGSSAMIGRNGFVIQDEAWSILGDQYGVSVAQRAGRLARAQHYQPVLMSQKIDEFLDAGLSEFMGRGIVLAVAARNEQDGLGRGELSQAQAVCKLMNQPLDGTLHERLTHSRVLDAESQAPDWGSLYPLRDPKTGNLLRGSIAYYVGEDSHAVPVEVRVDDSLV